MKPRRHFSEYTIPGKDSARAKAQAVLYLCAPGVNLRNVNVEWMAHRFNLTPETAADMLARARGRDA